jgi:ABC-type multidrug transport system ATPase subunit
LIQEAMDRLMSGRTSVVIAHRLSTVRAMDRILVFEHGRIMEEGNHEALLRRPDGHYRRLFERQSGMLGNEMCEEPPYVPLSALTPMPPERDHASSLGSDRSPHAVDSGGVARASETRAPLTTRRVAESD